LKCTLFAGFKSSSWPTSSHWFLKGMSDLGPHPGNRETVNATQRLSHSIF
jgi:hypothetical protein